MVTIICSSPEETELILVVTDSPTTPTSGMQTKETPQIYMLHFINKAKIPTQKTGGMLTATELH